MPSIRLKLTCVARRFQIISFIIHNVKTIFEDRFCVIEEKVHKVVSPTCMVKRCW